MKNLTLSIDDHELETARRYAAEHNTTVNAMVRDFLVNVTGISARRRLAVEKMIQLSQQTEFRMPPMSWSREDLYDRGAARADAERQRQSDTTQS